MPINQTVQLNGIRVMFVAYVFSHDEVALEDRDGRRFEDKGSCQHVPWQVCNGRSQPPWRRNVGERTGNSQPSGLNSVNFFDFTGHFGQWYFSELFALTHLFHYSYLYN